MDIAIELKGLCKAYGLTQAVRDVSFQVKKGSILGLLGPNGAGKSTIMRILAGLIDADAGQAFMCGLPINTSRGLLNGSIGYMPENNPLPEYMRVEEYLSYRGLLKKIPPKNIAARVKEVMDLCDLSRKAKHKLISSLSKGYRQRVGIADTLLADPKIIILDEPTIGLDPHQIIAIRQLITSLKEKSTVIISSHILQEIEACCDTVIILNNGTVVALGSPEALRMEFVSSAHYKIAFQPPSNPYIDLFIKELSDVLEAQKFSLQILDKTEQADSFYLECKVSSRFEFCDFLIEYCKAYPQLKLHKMVCLEPSLEDVFIAATKRHWEVIDNKF